MLLLLTFYSSSWPSFVSEGYNHRKNLSEILKLNAGNTAHKNFTLHGELLKYDFKNRKCNKLSRTKFALKENYKTYHALLNWKWRSEALPTNFRSRTKIHFWGNYKFLPILTQSVVSPCHYLWKWFFRPQFWKRHSKLFNTYYSLKYQ